MSTSRSGRAAGERLELSFSKRQHIPQLIFYAVLVGVAVMQWVHDVLPRPLAGVLIASWLALVVLTILDVRKRRRAGVVILLSRDGVTVVGSPMVTWSEVREVTVTRLSPRWMTWGRALDVVAIIPLEGVAMPDPPTYVRGARASAMRERGRDRRLTQFGTNLILMPYVLDANRSQIIDAVGGWGGVPVRVLPTPRRWRLVRTLPLVVLLGVLLALVVVLVTR